MQIKLIEDNWLIKIASYWDSYTVSQEEYEKITSTRYTTKLVEWVFVFEENPDYKKEELSSKMKRLREIHSQLKELWDVGITITMPSIVAINEARVAALNTEAEEIQADIVANYESTLVEDLYTSLFM